MSREGSEQAREGCTSRKKVTDMEVKEPQGQRRGSREMASGRGGSGAVMGEGWGADTPNNGASRIWRLWY